MESNIDEQDYLNAPPSLSEPHFDEEATLLSARPVVPLEEIKAKTRIRRPLVFGLAIAGALLLGITATAFYFSRPGADVASTFVDSEAIASGIQGFSTEQVRTDDATPLPGELPASSEAPVVSTNKSPVPIQSSDSDTPTPKKRAARLVDVITSNPGRYREKITREERRAARQEEKQRRREARREMRDDSSSDDLLRIREIFEGRRRP